MSSCRDRSLLWFVCPLNPSPLLLSIFLSPFQFHEIMCCRPCSMSNTHTLLLFLLLHHHRYFFVCVNLAQLWRFYKDFYVNIFFCGVLLLGFPLCVVVLSYDLQIEAQFMINTVGVFVCVIVCWCVCVCALRNVWMNTLSPKQKSWEPKKVTQQITNTNFRLSDALVPTCVLRSAGWVPRKHGFHTLDDCRIGNLAPHRGGDISIDGKPHSLLLRICMLKACVFLDCFRHLYFFTFFLHIVGEWFMINCNQTSGKTLYRILEWRILMRKYFGWLSRPWYFLVRFFVVMSCLSIDLINITVKELFIKIKIFNYCNYVN